MPLGLLNVLKVLLEPLTGLNVDVAGIEDELPEGTDVIATPGERT